MIKTLILLLGLTASLDLLATDVFGFLLDPCEMRLGIPVGEEEGQLTILTPHGLIETFPVEKVEGIAHYVLSESVFDLSELSKTALPYLKKIEIKDAELMIKGFPYQFIDGTVFILDQNGARRVVGQEEVGRIEALSYKDFHRKPLQKTLPIFSLPEGSSQCKAQESGQLPVRYLADKIQILETINNWEKGFRDTNDLSERSIFYPRPFLYDRKNRFGFIMFKTDGPQSNLLPFRYSFSNGHDFRFQGQTTFGGAFDAIGPRAAPMNLLATDLKFHFLHASFEGNLNAMGVGSASYKDDSGFHDYAFDHPRRTLGDVSFNHLALIGVDYANWGLSFGPMFPTFYVQVAQEAREATPQKSVPVVRLTWTGDKVKFKISGAKGGLKATNEVQKKSTVMNSDQAAEYADSYAMNFNFLRTGVEWDVAQDTRITTDLIWTTWDYKETTLGRPLKFNSTQQSVLSSIRRNFSRYVSVGLYTLWTMPVEKGTYAAQTLNRKENTLKLGGTFEFLF